MAQAHQSLKVNLNETNKTKWLPAILRNLCVVCLYFLSDEELFSEIRYKMCFRCLEQMQKIMSFVKLFIYRPFGGNIFRVSIDRQPDMKIVFMVGGVVLSSDERTTQHSPGTPASKRGTEGRRRELRDERGRFASKSRVEKSRTGFQRNRGIREWRAKRKLEFDENDPPTKLETRASKVRVHF